MSRREVINLLAATAAATGLSDRPASAMAVLAPSDERAQPAFDVRNIVTGSQIPRDNYSDQPYVVITKDGNWLCVLTTGAGAEGAQGQHVISTISSDKGRTWSTPVDIEPASGPEASWVMPLAVASGRVYVFYDYNAENLRYDTKSNDPKTARRVDSLGSYALKFSDDYGRTWSKKRYYIPMRLMRIDRENAYSGKLLYFWGVGKPITTRYGAIFGFAKIGKWGQPGSMMSSQGCFMRSMNILTEPDPDKIRWTTLPAGDEGLRAPRGPVAEETNLAELGDGSLYATYRTIEGYNCHAYSRDGGDTWTPPAYATYTPTGRRIKHPRAANFVKKFSNGKFILWYHNHAGESVLTAPWDAFSTRNPAWITGGVEKDGFIYWAEPEILLYDVDPAIRMSYPDFIEDNGQFYVTETMKTAARVHQIDRSLLEGLWNQAETRSICRSGLVFTQSEKDIRSGTAASIPPLPSLTAGGFTVEFWIYLRELTPKQTILDTRVESGKGIAIVISPRSTMELILSDGTRKSSWDSDPGVHEGTLKTGIWQHVVFTVDGGPKIITVIIDGVLNDGGSVRDAGWARFDPALADVNGLASAQIAPSIFGKVKLFRIYNRYLRTSEAVGNWRAGI